MGLSDDQRALLRLLAQREEGYEDIAALMGLSVEEVRARVKRALAALNEDQTSPAAGPVAAGDPPPPPVAKASSGAVPPAAPPAEGRVESSPSSGSASSPSPERTTHRPSAPQRQRAPIERRRLWELVGGAIVVILLILFATGAVSIGGDDDSGSDSSSTTGATSEGVNTVTKRATKLTQAILEAVDGGDAKGLAVFGRSKGAVILLLQAESLPPSSKDRSYAISLARSPAERIPIAVTRVPASGTIETQYPVPAEALGLLANGFDEMELSLVSNADLKSALTESGKERKAPDYDSEDVLRGEVTGPIVNIASKEEG